MSGRDVTEPTRQRPLNRAAAADGRLSLLVVYSGGVSSFPLPAAGDVTVGRSREADLHVADDSLSRRHASLRVEGGAAFVKDLGSQHGTRLNQQPVAGEWLPFDAGDALKLGDVTAVLQRTGAPRLVRRLWAHEHFEVQLDEHCARPGAPFAVVRLAMAGSKAGDLAAAEAISRRLPPADVVASYAPGQLEVLMLDAPPAEAQQRADALVAALEALGISSRAGVACSPRDGRDAERLLELAGADAERPGATGTRAGPVIASPAMKRLHEMISRVAAGDISVLVLGETGAGKEVIARAIHERSPRAKKPYVAINCAAFTESLLESELFGYERGAFTGAVEARAGLFESAEGGTMCLDELGELPLATQAKLLRVLEERAVRRVGGTKTRSIDVRFVASTNRDLAAAVKEGRFREDLFFRVAGITLSVPPLRERAEELEPLVSMFIAAAAKKLGGRPPKVSAVALERLRAYSWPGNVRELKNVVDRAVLLAERGELSLEHLPLAKMSVPLLDATPAPAPEPAPAGPGAPERERITAALAECAGNQTQAAKLLGISRRTLIYRLEEYGLPRPVKGARRQG